MNKTIQLRVKKLINNDLRVLQEQVISNNFYQPEEVNTILKDMLRLNNHYRRLNRKASFYPKTKP